MCGRWSWPSPAAAGSALPPRTSSPGWAWASCASPTRRTFEPSNINRQFAAYVDTLGVNKAEAVAAELRRINPDLSLRTFAEGVTETSARRPPRRRRRRRGRPGLLESRPRAAPSQRGRPSRAMGVHQSGRGRDHDGDVVRSVAAGSGRAWSATPVNRPEPGPSASFLPVLPRGGDARASCAGHRGRAAQRPSRRPRELLRGDVPGQRARARDRARPAGARGRTRPVGVRPGRAKLRFWDAGREHFARRATPWSPLRTLCERPDAPALVVAQLLGACDRY